METVSGLHWFVIQSASGDTDVRALLELTNSSLQQQPRLFLPTKATSPIFPALDVVSPLLGTHVEILHSPAADPAPAGGGAGLLGPWRLEEALGNGNGDGDPAAVAPAIPDWKISCSGFHEEREVVPVG